MSNENEKAIKELDALMEEDSRVAAMLRREAEAIVTGGDLDVASVDRRHSLVENLRKMEEAYAAAGRPSKEIEPVRRLIHQLGVVGTLEPLRDPTLLVDFGRKAGKKTAERAREERDRSVFIKLERNKRYTFLNPKKLVPPLVDRLPDGRKHYADSFVSVLMEFIMRRPLNQWAVWITNTMVSVYKLRRPEYDYEFLQKIVDLMEGTFGMVPRELGKLQFAEQNPVSWPAERPEPPCVVRLMPEGTETPPEAPCELVAPFGAEADRGELMRSSAECLAESCRQYDADHPEGPRSSELISSGLAAAVDGELASVVVEMAVGADSTSNSPALVAGAEAADPATPCPPDGEQTIVPESEGEEGCPQNTSS